MRQLAGTKTMYRRAHAAPLAGLISGREVYLGKIQPSLIVTTLPSVLTTWKASGTSATPIKGANEEGHPKHEDEDLFETLNGPETLTFRREIRRSIQFTSAAKTISESRTSSWN